MSERLLALAMAAVLWWPSCGSQRNAPRAAVAPPDEVWFAPNSGSRDLSALFTRPQAWARAREHVDVFQLYQSQVAVASPDAVPGLASVDAFRLLREWKIDTALEVGSLKDWGCSGEHTAPATLVAMEAVERAGGNVERLVMDEPLVGAESCRLRLPEAARQVAAYVGGVHAHRPRVQIGLVEPYPRYRAAPLEAWLDLLAAEGAPPAFLHLDVDRQYARRQQVAVAADLLRLQEACRRRGVAFGLVYWSDEDSDAAYARDVRAWARQVQQAIGTPAHVVVQSWAEKPDGSHEVPANLPEDGRDTHTGLLLDVLGLR